MHILIIFAHPTRHSFCGSILTEVLTEFAAREHEVEVLDLYAEGFNPVLSRPEWQAYETCLSGDIQPYADQIRRSDGLVWIFPTWNYGLPAILKGYLDRVWKPNVAFRIDKSRKVHFDLFNNLKFYIVAATYGSSWSASTFVGNPCKQVLSRCLKRHFPSSAGFSWLALYGMDRPSPRRLDLFLTKVRRTIRYQLIRVTD